MAVDKLVDSTQLDADLTSVANAIRTKGGTSAQMAFPSGFVSAVQAIPTGGGGGLTTIATGTFTPASAGYQTTISVGTKMPQTDFWFKIKAEEGTEFSYYQNSKIQYAYQLQVVNSDMGYYNLSADVYRQAITPTRAYDVNNNGTITTVTIGDCLSHGKAINKTNSAGMSFNTLKITRDSNGFSIFCGLSNSGYSFDVGTTYEWEVVYFGTSPNTDIVEVTV